MFDWQKKKLLRCSVLLKSTQEVARAFNQKERNPRLCFVLPLHFFRINKSKRRDSYGRSSNFVQRRLTTSFKKVKATFFQDFHWLVYLFHTIYIINYLHIKVKLQQMITEQNKWSTDYKNVCGGQSSKGFLVGHHLLLDK